MVTRKIRSESSFNPLVASTVLLLAVALSGAEPALAACPNPNPNPNAKLRVLSDFNGDCRSEIVWRHADGSNALWYTNGTTHSGSALLLGAPHPWFLSGTGDFDGDGKADLLWRGPEGSVAVWLMNDATKTASDYVRTEIPFSWDIAGIGDFNGDGKSDILWRAADGTVAIWFMNGMSLANSALVGSVPGEWFMAGVGDFNGDGKSDILWRASDSSVAIWQMNGATVANSALTTSVPISWSVSLVGDFDGNGKADIFWRDIDGTNAIWLMNGTNAATRAVVNLTPTSWQPASSGDYNGDGKTDIMWRNLSDGSVAVWLMNGIAIGSSAIIAAVPDFGWATLPMTPTASGSIPACTPVTPTDAVQPSLVASRLSGVAPLAVFFDATGTTAKATTRPFHELEYSWHFGDVGSGNWASTPDMPNLSRDLAMGPVAAHVFESPGTYNVCLSVFDGANTVLSRVQIRVENPDVVFAGAKTTCFSNTTDFTGCPAGASQVTTSNFATVGSAATATNAVRRLLLRRGHTFTGGGALRASGPGILGAFGAGARPKVTGASTMLTISGGATPTVKDWRVMDLEFDGQSGALAEAIGASGGADQTLILRVDIHNVKNGIIFPSSILNYWNGAGGFPGHTLWDQLAIVDSRINTLNLNGDGGGVFISATRLAILGCDMDTADKGQHTIRIPHTRKAVLTNNILGRPYPSKHVIKIHAPGWTSPGVENPGGVGTYTEQVVIADNKIIGGIAGVDYTVNLASQNPSVDERVREVLYERNWHVAGAGQQVALHIWTSETTVRNNVFSLTGAVVHWGIHIFGSGGVAAPSDLIRVYNNTFYSNDADNDFQAVRIAAGATNVTVKNNLAYAPLDLQHVMLMNNGTGTVVSNNSSDAQVGSLAPGFVVALPLVPAHFRLAAGSPALDSGVRIPVFSDFFRIDRLRNGAIDLGAAERP